MYFSDFRYGRLLELVKRKRKPFFDVFCEVLDAGLDAVEKAGGRS